MTDRTIVVPVDKQGMMDYENDISKTDRMKYFTLPDEEFEIMQKNGFFDRVNSDFNLMIDDFEEEIIPTSSLDAVKKLLDQFKLYCPFFASALNYAIRQKTELCLEF